MGKAKIITSKHTFLFHVNLTIPREISSNILGQLSDIRNKINNNPNHLTLILNNRIDHATHLNEIILNKLAIPYEPSRRKRGLVNAVGSLSRWLFGTLDNDDRSRINGYIETLKKNDGNLHSALLKQQSVLQEMTEKYATSFAKLADNQLTLQSQINTLTRELNELLSFEQAFSLTVIIDNLILQLQAIQNLLNNVYTAVSFAKLNVLHTSIIEPEQLKAIIFKLNKIYQDREIPLLNSLMNYYNLFSSQILIKGDILIFKIHTPIVTKPYNIFQLYPVPISGHMIIPEQPFLLLDEKDYWTTIEECPEIENFYYCKHFLLHKKQPCLVDIIKKGQNSCTSMNVQFSESSITQINSHQVLIIPKKPTIIQGQCEANGIFEVSKPSIVTLENCNVIIEGRQFQTEGTLHDDFVFELPKLKSSTTNTKVLSSTVKLKSIDTSELRHIEAVARNLQVAELSQMDNKHSWANTILLICLFVSSSALVIYVKFIHPDLKRRTRKKMENPEPSENKEPLFSELRDGGVM